MTEYARPELLVDGDWLQSRLGDPNLRIVDCDVRDSYRRAHIPGAVCPTEYRFKDPSSPVFVMQPDQFAAAMSELGIGNDTEVVLYDAAGSLNAGRAWWCLAYFGHQKARVLNGGWNRWLKEGRPLTMAEPNIPKASFVPRVDDSQRATAEYLMAALSRPDVVVLDVRTDGEWDGSATRGNKRSGHIPGAVHLEWTNNLVADDERCFKSPDDLKAMLEAAGVTPDKEVITV